MQEKNLTDLSRRFKDAGGGEGVCRISKRQNTVLPVARLIVEIGRDSSGRIFFDLIPVEQKNGDRQLTPHWTAEINSRSGKSGFKLSIVGRLI